MLITYYSETGNTGQMAKAVAEGGGKVKGVEVKLKRIEETTLNDLLESNVIIMGSPTYYGIMAAPVKKLLDESVKIHGKLEGKIGGHSPLQGEAQPGLRPLFYQYSKRCWSTA